MLRLNQKEPLRLRNEAIIARLKELLTKAEEGIITDMIVIHRFRTEVNNFEFCFSDNYEISRRLEVVGAVDLWKKITLEKCATETK